MDPDLEAGCENLMIKTVESRKHFKKLCKEYYQKQSIMENKLLNFQTEVCTNISLKKKHPIPNIQEDVDTLESFLIENSEKQVKCQEFMEQIRNLITIVQQLKKDTIGKILREPLNPQTMLAHAKEKHSA